jgi:predicted amidohydrolase YtcJ
VLPLRELLDSGLVASETLVFGSDAPVVRANPEDSIQAAVQRRRAGMDESGAIALGQAISEREAWASFGV